MPRRAARGSPKQKTTILFKAGNLPGNPDELFRRVFWKSDFLAGEAHNFWREVKKAEPAGLPIQAWKDWISKRGFIEKKDSRWHLSVGFLRELEQMLTVYSTESGLRYQLA